MLSASLDGFKHIRYPLPSFPPPSFGFTGLWWLRWGLWSMRFVKRLRRRRWWCSVEMARRSSPSSSVIGGDHRCGREVFNLLFLLINMRRRFHIGVSVPTVILVEGYRDHVLGFGFRLAASLFWDRRRTHGYRRAGWNAGARRDGGLLGEVGERDSSSSFGR